MLELFSPPPEDPLPVSGDSSHRYKSDLPSTLGEVVVTDPRDPFVWLAGHLDRPSDAPSDKGKQLLWEVYRFSVNPLKDPKDSKWRDKIMGTQDLMSDISDTDLRCVAAYDAYLFPIAKEVASPQELVDSHQQVKLYEPHETALAGILHTARGFNDHGPEALPKY
jgi:hypothetical protein